ncbi:hypothetical protein [Paraliobacillus sp. JSM ZJ581]
MLQTLYQYLLIAPSTACHFLNAGAPFNQLFHAIKTILPIYF